MTKMAAMPIYSKNPFKTFLSRMINQITLKLNTNHKRFKPYNININDDPRLTLSYFITTSTLFI